MCGGFVHTEEDCDSVSYKYVISCPECNLYLCKESSVSSMDARTKAAETWNKRYRLWD